MNRLKFLLDKLMMRSSLQKLMYMTWTQKSKLLLMIKLILSQFRIQNTSTFHIRTKFINRQRKLPRFVQKMKFIGPKKGLALHKIWRMIRRTESMKGRISQIVWTMIIKMKNTNKWECFLKMYLKILSNNLTKTMYESMLQIIPIGNKYPN